MGWPVESIGIIYWGRVIPTTIGYGKQFDIASLHKIYYAKSYCRGKTVMSPCPRFSALRVKPGCLLERKRAFERAVELDFRRPWTPIDNAKIESFHGRFRQDCLNIHWFLSLDDAKSKPDASRQLPYCNKQYRRILGCVIQQSWIALFRTTYKDYTI